MEKTFLIVTPVYNSEEWIAKCIESVRRQSYKKFVQVIVNDASTDNTLEEAKRAINKDPRCILIQKDSKKGIAHSHIVAHEYLGKKAEDDDIYIHVDGDDWLAHDDVLKRLSQVYEDKDVWATYGNYEATDGSPSICRQVDGLRPARFEIRAGWPYSHLRTFRKFLWDNVALGEMKDSQNQLLSAAFDVAIFAPILEMAGPRVRFLNETLYVYNRHNPLSEDRVSISEQARCAIEVADKPYRQPL